MIDPEVNKDRAKEICARFNPTIPSGMMLYTTPACFGVSYTPPMATPSGVTGMQVKFNQPKESFEKEADDACAAIHRYAKAMNKRFDVPNEKSQRVIECEKTMIDGKCQCGYSAKASETASELRSVVGSYTHRGVYVKDEPEEDEEVLW